MRHARVKKLLPGSPKAFPVRSIPRDIYFCKPDARPIKRNGKLPFRAIASLAVSTRETNGTTSFETSGILARNGWIVPAKPRNEPVAVKTFRALRQAGLPKLKRAKLHKRELIVEHVDYLLWLETRREKLSRKPKAATRNPRILDCEGCSLCGKTH